MKLTLLGTSPGTFPLEGRRHTSFTVEQDGGVYFFDAGEACSRTAHLNGIDLLAVRAIFISHGHIDHCGGLPNLLWHIDRLDKDGHDDDPMAGKTIQLFAASEEIYTALEMMLYQGGAGFGSSFDIDAETISDGEIFSDACLRVLAQHNTHLGTPLNGEEWRSFSFRIESGGKSIVYSADLACIDELQPILDPCDLLLMETAHHDVAEVCHFLKDCDARIKRIVFTHHGSAMLTDTEGERQRAADILGEPPVIAQDKMVIEV